MKQFSLYLTILFGLFVLFWLISNIIVPWQQKQYLEEVKLHLSQTKHHEDDHFYNLKQSLNDFCLIKDISFWVFVLLTGLTLILFETSIRKQHFVEM